MQTTTYHNPASDPLNNSERPLPVRLLVVLSLLVWAVGSAATRLWGHFLFLPTNLLSLYGCFLALALVMPLIVVGIFRWQAIPPDRAAAYVLWLVVPSMGMDVLTLEFFPQLFANMPASASGLFGSWLLWGYTISLITGLVIAQSDKVAN